MTSSSFPIHSFRIVLLSWLLLVSGCATRAPVVTPYPHPAQQVDREQKKRSPQKIRKPCPENPLTVTIRKQARQLIQQGRPDAAAQVLERGLRISPKDGWLWAELAAIRLAQNRPAQAVSLARKADSLACNDPSLRKRALQIIAVAEQNVSGQ